MTTKEPPKGSSGRKYSPEERAQAVRLVRQLRREIGTNCVIRRKTDTGSGAKRTTFRSYPDKVPAESGQLT